jgi:hypothetical protein
VWRALKRDFDANVERYVVKHRSKTDNDASVGDIDDRSMQFLYKKAFNYAKGRNDAHIRVLKTFKLLFL